MLSANISSRLYYKEISAINVWFLAKDKNEYLYGKWKACFLILTDVEICERNWNWGNRLRATDRHFHPIFIRRFVMLEM